MREELRNKYSGYFYRKFKFLIAVIVLFLLTVTGCATTKIIDRLAPGTPKGFVEFRLERGAAIPSTTYLCAADFIGIDEISPDGKVIATEKWVNPYDHRFRIAAISGYHEYSFWYTLYCNGNGHMERVKIRVYEGMITPILIRTVIETSRQEGMLQVYGVSIYITNESPIPVPQKDN